MSGELIVKSKLELLARALWIQDTPMIRGMEPEYRGKRQAVYLRLKEYGYLDDHTVDRLLNQLEDAQDSLTKQIDYLNSTLFIMHEGHPHLEPGSLNRRIIRIVDPDALVSMHRKLSVDDQEEQWHWHPIARFIDAERKHLKKFATHETHCHLGGALPPVWFWIALMGGDLVFGRFQDSLTQVLNKKLVAKWSDAIGRAARLRLQLAFFLANYFEEYENLRLFPHIPARQWKKVSTVPLSLNSESINSFEFMDLPIRDLSFKLLETNLLRRDWRKDHCFIDPLRRVTSGHSTRPHFASGERALLYYLRKFLDKTKSKSHFRRLRKRLEFMGEQYLSMRFSFHRLAVHDEGSQGLFRFLQTFAQRGGLFSNGRPDRRTSKRRGLRGFSNERLDRRRSRRHRFHSDGKQARRASQRNRLRRYTYRLERDRMRIALEMHQVSPCPHGAQPVGQEMRVSLGKGTVAPLELRAWAEGALTANLNEKAGATEKTMPVLLTIHTHKGGSNRKATKRALNTAKKLHYLLLDRPQLRRWITGFDAAGNERDNPPRVFAPAYRYLQYVNQSYRPKHRHDPGMALRFTYHVGEDYDDLLSALRHMDETSQLLLPKRAGGRLGHALALGEDPELFYRMRATHREVKLGTHILDLIWAWGKLHEHGALNQFLWLEEKLAKLIKSVDVNAECSSGVLADTYRKMWIEEDCNHKRAPFSEEALLHGLNLHNMGTTYLSIEATSKWLQLTSHLQQLLRHQLAKKPITIEANPTSNLIVGSFKDYTLLPYQRLVNDRLAVSLNTDDPGMFMATLPGEFVAIYRGLLDSGTAARDAMRWLEDRATDARHSVFVPQTWLCFDKKQVPTCEQKLDVMFGPHEAR